MSALESFHFLRPGWLLLLLPYLLILFLGLRREGPSRQWKPLIAEHLLPALIVRNRARSRLSPKWVARVLGVLLAVAMAGPAWQRGVSPYAEDNAALLIAVDLSASMAGSDIQPSRLQRARDKILTLVERRGDAYTALLAYAGSAHTVLPLSNDAQVLLHYLDALRVGMLPREGKAPGRVLSLALEALGEGDRSGTLLLVGDGASEADSAAFAGLAAQSRLQLLVWGIGKTQQQLAEEARRGLNSRAQPLQEEALRAIAEAAGGQYQPLTSDDADVDRLQRLIDRHFLIGEDSARPWIDAGYLLTFPISALFLLWFRRGWVLQW